MSITIQPPFAQHDTTDSAVTHNYPVTLYREPVFNVGDPGNPGHRMLHTDLRRVFEFVRDGHPRVGTRSSPHQAGAGSRAPQGREGRER